MVTDKQLKITVRTDNAKLTDQFYLHLMETLKSFLILKQ